MFSCQSFKISVSIWWWMVRPAKYQKVCHINRENTNSRLLNNGVEHWTRIAHTSAVLYTDLLNEINIHLAEMLAHTDSYRFRKYLLQPHTQGAAETRISLERSVNTQGKKENDGVHWLVSSSYHKRYQKRGSFSCFLKKRSVVGIEILDISSELPVCRFCQAGYLARVAAAWLTDQTIYGLWPTSFALAALHEPGMFPMLERGFSKVQPWTV